MPLGAAEKILVRTRASPVHRRVSDGGRICHAGRHAIVFASIAARETRSLHLATGPLASRSVPFHYGHRHALTDSYRRRLARLNILKPLVFSYTTPFRNSLLRGD